MFASCLWMRLPLPRQPCYRGHYRWLGRIGTVGSPVYGTTMHLLHKTLAWLVRRFSGCRGFAFLFGGRLPPYCSGHGPGLFSFGGAGYYPFAGGRGRAAPRLTKEEKRYTFPTIWCARCRLTPYKSATC